MKSTQNGLDRESHDQATSGHTAAEWHTNIHYNCRGKFTQAELLITRYLLTTNFQAAAAALLMSRTSTTTTKVINADTSLTFLYQNNLDFADDVNHVGAILLDPMTYTAAALACYGISERLISQDTLQSHLPDFTAQLSYLPNQNRVRERQEYWIAGAVLIHTQGSLISEYAPTEAYSGRFLPVLCSQSFETNDPYVETAASGSQLTVKANGNHYVGFRNKKSFRFLGIRYAEEPARFEHSKLYRGDGGLYDATKHGSQCLQKGEGSADCLFLNIQTPFVSHSLLFYTVSLFLTMPHSRYIPKEGSKVDLRPVHLWIHGGGNPARILLYLPPNLISVFSLRIWYR